MIELTDENSLINEELKNTVILASEAALSYMKRTGDIDIAIVTDERIRELNRTFRNVDSATDVLSFPSSEEIIEGPPALGFLGDIAISFETAERQALEYGHSLGRELGFLAVHGALHLMGLDHGTPEEEAAMNKKQEEILEGIGMKR
jgi:probable rRNA maturation factor